MLSRDRLSLGFNDTFPEMIEKLRTSRHAQKPIRLLACRLHSWMKLNSFGFLIFDIEPYTKDL